MVYHANQIHLQQEKALMEYNFYTSIAKYYDYIFPENQGQINFIRNFISKHKKDINLLDIGCATGSTLLALSKEIYSGVGIDLDEELIHIAREKCLKRCEHVFFKKMNMLNINETFFPSSFDLITCFGNTIPHLNNLDEISLFLKHVHDLLKINGVFLCQLINFDRVLDMNISNLSTIDNDHIKFIRNYKSSVKSQSVEFNTTLIIKNENITLKNSIPLYPIRQSELMMLMLGNGFSDISRFGNFKMNQFNQNSVSVILKAIKL